MGLLYLPKRFATRQPLVPVLRRDGFHAHLKACVLGNHPNNEIVSGGLREAIDANFELRHDSEAGIGFGHSTSGGTNPRYRLNIPYEPSIDPFASNPGFSVFYYGFITEESTNARIIGIRGTSNFGFSIRDSWDGGHGNTRLEFKGDWGGGGNQSSNIVMPKDSGVGVSLNRIAFVIQWRDNGGTPQLKYWAKVEGSKQAYLIDDWAVYAEGEPDPGAASAMFILVHPQNFASTEYLHCSAFYGEILNDGDIAFLLENPYGMFEADPHEQYVYSAAGGADVTVALTGQAIATALGNFTHQHDVPLSGSEIAAALGTLNPTLSCPLVGQEIVTEQGSLVPDLQVPLSGQEVATELGSLSPGFFALLTGQEIGTEQGSLGVDLKVPLLGQEVATEQGILGVDLQIALLGQEIAAALGTMAVDLSVPLTGQEIVTALGIAGVDLTVPLTGEEIASLQGTLTPLVGGTVALVGQEVAIALGILGVINEGVGGVDAKWRKRRWRENEGRRRVVTSSTGFSNRHINVTIRRR